MRIFAFHLLNDYSGSPKVLGQLLKAWTRAGIEVHLGTCSAKTGFLSDIPAVHYHPYWYRWSANPLIRFFNLMTSQILLILQFWRKVTTNDIVYVNTVLPFGAAILGKLKGCRVIYHVHETSMKPKVFKQFLFAMVRLCADEVIYVSDYLANTERVKGPRIHTVHNAIENEFSARAAKFSKMDSTRNRVLMICSLKTYKGVFEFVALAALHPDKSFRLVLNATNDELKRFFANTQLAANVELFPAQHDVHPHYQWADAVLNLSRSSEWVETFGLTIIEAMAYKLPVITPEVGGVVELITNGVEGYQVDSRNLPLLSQKLSLILDEPNTYKRMQLASLERLSFFSEAAFVGKIDGILDLV